MQNEPIEVEYVETDNVFGALRRCCPVCGDDILISPEALPLEKYCRFCGQRIERRKNGE